MARDQADFAGRLDRPFELSPTGREPDRLGRAVFRQSGREAGSAERPGTGPGARHKDRSFKDGSTKELETPFKQSLAWRLLKSACQSVQESTP